MVLNCVDLVVEVSRKDLISASKSKVRRKRGHNSGSSNVGNLKKKFFFGSLDVKIAAYMQIRLGFRRPTTSTIRLLETKTLEPSG